MAVFPDQESKRLISTAIQKLPLLPNKIDLVEKATSDLAWAAVTIRGKSEKESENDFKRAAADARNEIQKLIGSIDRFIRCANSLGQVAVRSIDREVTPEVFAEDIGYVYVSNARLSMSALRDKAYDALSGLPEVKKPRGAGHKNGPAEHVTEVAGKWYENLTGKRVARTHNAYTGKTSSHFTNFLDEIFTALNIELLPGIRTLT